MNEEKYPRLSERVRKDREDSEELLKQFIWVVCVDNGGDCRFLVFAQVGPFLQEWILERSLHSVTFDGCHGDFCLHPFDLSTT